MSYLETKRLDLRQIYETDVESIFNNWCKDPEVAKYMTWDAHENIEVTKTIMEKWLSEETDRYVIVLRETNEIIGMIDIVRIENGIPEIGYVSGKKWWGNGYMTEALEAFSESLFEKGYKKIKIEALVENVGSNRVIQKNNFEFAGTRKMEFKGEIKECNTYYKEDPHPIEIVDASFKKDEVENFRKDLLLKMIKSPAIIMLIAVVVALLGVVLGFTAFKDQSFSKAFIISGFIGLAIFIFNGVLILYMSLYVKKMLQEYTKHSDDSGMVSVKIHIRNKRYKVYLGEKNCIIEFKRKEIKNVFIRKSIIMVNTIFGAVFLPNIPEVKELFVNE